MSQEWMTKATFFLLRVVTGSLFFMSGAVILLGWFGGMPGSNHQAPPVLSQMWIGGALELFGGAAIVLGLFTRPVAFILSGEMAVAYWQFHAPQSFWPVVNNGVAAVLDCFIFLYFAAHGGGEWSLDALIGRKVKRTI